MFAFFFIILISVITRECSSQNTEGSYRGKFIGKLNSYHHQVSGEVYAVDESTLLLENFNYDGTGDDTFFWAGDSGRPGPQGFIVPNEFGKSNVLEMYHNEGVRLTLPEGKRISRIKWFAVYDIASQNAFGDVYVPDEFEEPAPRSVGPLAGSAHASSRPVTFLDANSFLIPEFRYDGSGKEVYFWTGVGPQPSSRGIKIPDEYGYLDPIRAYSGEDLRLELPGGRSVFDVQWVAVYDVAAKRALASVLLPDALNVPPALLATHPYRSTLPHCKQLHRDLQVSWEVFGNQITIQLAGQMDEDEYMAFGISGAEARSQMLGADVAVAQYDHKLQRGLATDYNITALAPCVQVLGRWRGVCRDEQLGAQDSHQLLAASRDAGLTLVTYRRDLTPTEEMDRAWVRDGPTHVVWALGALDHAREPAFHRLYQRHDLALAVHAPTPDDDCSPFTVGSREAPAPWKVAELSDPALRVFSFRLGPAGGRRGVAGRGRGAAPALAWYVNGQLAPALRLARGLRYTFEVYGGDDPHSPDRYHPLVLSTDPVGGLRRLERLGGRARGAVRLLAGAHYTRRATYTPTAAGPLCAARRAAGADGRRDDSYATFDAFNRSLVWNCSAAPPARLRVAPNDTWPDRVYYHSYTHSGMGYYVTIMNQHRSPFGGMSSGAPLAAPLAAPLVEPLAAPLAALVLALARWLP